MIQLVSRHILGGFGNRKKSKKGVLSQKSETLIVYVIVLVQLYKQNGKQPAPGVQWW